MQALKEIRHESNDKTARIIALPLESTAPNKKSPPLDAVNSYLGASENKIAASSPTPRTALRRSLSRPPLGKFANSLLIVLLVLGWYWYQRIQTPQNALDTQPTLPASTGKAISSDTKVFADEAAIMEQQHQPQQAIRPTRWSSKWMRYSMQLNLGAPIWVSKELVMSGRWRQYSWAMAVKAPNPVSAKLKATMAIRLQPSWPTRLDVDLANISARVEQAMPTALEPQEHSAYAAEEDVETLELPATPPAALPQKARMHVSPSAPAEVDATAPTNLAIQQKTPPAADNAVEEPESFVTLSSTSSPQPAKMQITPSVLTPSDQAAITYEKALTYYRQGRQVEAEATLWLALDLDPSHIDARALAVHLMFEQGRLSKAHELLLVGIEAAPQHYPFVQSLARILASQGQIQAALTQMEQGQNFAQQDPEYLALLAWLYQRSDRHQEAARSYIDALALNPEQGKWWLGLAISLEAKQDRLGAIEAYEYALAMGLEAGLRQFAVQQRQRLALL